MRDGKPTLSVVSDNGTQPSGRKRIATDVFAAFGRRPRLLDLFCCAGGAGTGYFRAGFDVVGIDLNRQPNYPFAFIQTDALNLDPKFISTFDAIHASPLCQSYSDLHGSSFISGGSDVDHLSLENSLRESGFHSGRCFVCATPKDPCAGQNASAFEEADFENRLVPF